MDRSASASRNGAPENNLEPELEQTFVKNVGARSKTPVQLNSDKGNEVITVSNGENQIAGHQLHNMFATFMADMRAKTLN
jgi:hypothetical protein